MVARSLSPCLFLRGVPNGFSCSGSNADAAIGGSDNHRADIPNERRGSIGRPTTVVYAEALSTSEILAGIRSGRVLVDLTGSTIGCSTSEPQRRLHLPLWEALCGLPPEEEVTVEVHVAHCNGAIANLQIDSVTAEPSYTQPVTSDDQTLLFHWKSDGKHHWLHPEITNLMATYCFWEMRST